MACASDRAIRKAFGIATNESAPLQGRAGFYRRCGAALIDAVAVSAAFQLVAAVLFAATLGAMQTTSGFHIKHCERKVAIADLPKGLAPAPPADADAAVICRISFFGLETARQLTVSRTAKGGADEEASQTYMCFGTTLGKRMFSLRVIDPTASKRNGIPLRKAMVRNLLIWSWAIPAESWLPGAGLLGLAWIAWILIQGDRIAGTAVLRV
jgi:uncharacterized RDD family membrane protein YckC